MRDIGRRRFPRIPGVPNHPGFAKTILGDPHFKKPYGSWLFLWTYFTDLVNQQCEYMGLIRTGELNGHFTGQNRDLNDFKWIYNIIKNMDKNTMSLFRRGEYRISGWFYTENDVLNFGM